MTRLLILTHIHSVERNLFWYTYRISSNIVREVINYTYLFDFQWTLPYNLMLSKHHKQYRLFGTNIANKQKEADSTLLQAKPFIIQ